MQKSQKNGTMTNAVGQYLRDNEFKTFKEMALISMIII